jgi:hypothetical protein
MINRIGGAQVNDEHKTSQSPASKGAPKPEYPVQPPQPVKSGELSHDQVTIKSAGQIDQDGEGK